MTSSSRKTRSRPAGVRHRRSPVLSAAHAALVALAAALVACNGRSGEAGARTVKIGVDLPLSGGEAAFGIPTENGVVLALEEAKTHRFAGGAYALELVVLDDAVEGTHDPAQGAQNVKTFVQDQAVLAMIGPFNSNVAKAEIPLTNAAQLAQISPSSTNDGLTVGAPARALRTAHPGLRTYFRLCARDANQGAVIARVARTRLRARRMYLVDDNETYGKGLADVVEAEFPRMGGTVLGHEHITRNQQDFTALLTKIKAANPDVLVFGGTTPTGGALLRKQMADAVMRSTPFVGGDGISDAGFEQLAGDEANGVYMTAAAPDVEKLPAAKAFVAAYGARFKASAGPYSANAYTAAKIEIAAIENAIARNGGRMPTRAAVLANVAATADFDSPIGKVGFDPNGDTTAAVVSLSEVKNGKRVTIDEITVRTSGSAATPR